MLQFIGQPQAPDPPAQYANKAGIYGNPQEMRIVFFLTGPSAHDVVVSEIIMSPMMMKGLSRYLPTRIKEWEDDFGVISMPEDKDLLNDLFGVNLKDIPDEGEPDDGQEPSG